MHKREASVVLSSSRGGRPEPDIVLFKDYNDWPNVFELINYNNNVAKRHEHSFTIRDTWSNLLEDAAESAPAPALAATPPAPLEPVIATEPACNKSQRSQDQTAAYENTQGLAWRQIRNEYLCDQVSCLVRARGGLACFKLGRKHYEIAADVAATWQKAINDGSASIQDPSKRLIDAIIAGHELAELKLSRSRTRTPQQQQQPELLPQQSPQQSPLPYYPQYMLYPPP